MRADRLVAVLLLLQQRGQVTAAEVAEELEVSERTARRDLDALGMAGIPIYSVQGRGGGWRLAGGGTTDLSGLNAEEARALFLLAGPQAHVTPDVRAALRKLLSALPQELRDQAEAAARSTVVDPTGWDQRAPDHPPPPLLDRVQRAVVDGRQLRLDYADRTGATSTRVVHPLGIAAKGHTWYLLTNTDQGPRTFRVDRIQHAEPTGDPVVRPDDFDLSTAWQDVVDSVEQLRTPVVARATVLAAALGHLRLMVGSRLRIVGGTTPDYVEAEIRGHSIRSLTASLAGFGAAVVVHDPPELRVALRNVALELLATHPEDLTSSAFSAGDPSR